MQEGNSNKLSTNDLYNEIDLKEILRILFQGKMIIVALTAFISIIGIIYSLLLPNIYESKTLLVPVNPTSSISKALGSYNDLAGFAGINLPSRDYESNSAKAVKKIGSLSFFEKNILPNIYLPNLMAVESWSPKLNIVNYDEKIFDINTNAWVRDYSYPKKQIPSAQESYKVFSKNYLTLIEDKKSGFITLSIKHQSPFIAKQWAELAVNEVNNFYRQKDKEESERATSYLNQQILMTGLSEIKQVLAQLLQEETKKLSLIEANQSYVFEYVDPPAVMEKKSAPNRALIFIISALLGGMLGSILVLIRHYVRDEKTP